MPEKYKNVNKKCFNYHVWYFIKKSKIYYSRINKRQCHKQQFCSKTIFVRLILWVSWLLDSQEITLWGYCSVFSYLKRSPYLITYAHVGGTEVLLFLSTWTLKIKLLTCPHLNLDLNPTEDLRWPIKFNRDCFKDLMFLKQLSHRGKDFFETNSHSSCGDLSETCRFVSETFWKRRDTDSYINQDVAGKSWRNLYSCKDFFSMMSR